MQFGIDVLLALAVPEPIAVDLGSGSGAIAIAMDTEVPNAAACTLLQRRLRPCTGPGGTSTPTAGLSDSSRVTSPTRCPESRWHRLRRRVEPAVRAGRRDPD